MAIQAHYFYSDNNNNNDYSFMETAATPPAGLIDQQQDFTPPPQLFPNYKNLNPPHTHNEFEHFLNLQNERLILALEKQRKQQAAVLMKKYESKSRFLMMQKDEEIAQASNTRMELENFLTKLESEKQAWQTLAQENESTVASLNAALIQRFSDAQSSSPNTPQQQQENNSKFMCKCCNSRNSCVVMLPCRHLSCCQDCDLFLHSCPLCTMPKKATIHALLI